MSSEPNPGTLGNAVSEVIGSLDVIEAVFTHVRERTSAAGPWRAMQDITRELEARRKGRSPAALAERKVERGRRGRDA